MDNVSFGKGVVPETIPTCILDRNKKLIIPNKPLTNYDLQTYAECLKIPFFRGVFMKDSLPKRIWRNESAIVNMDNSDGPGTHWVCYKKIGDTVYYFDSFGNLPPPLELQRYFQHVKNVYYNLERYQQWNTDICGHLCLDFLASTIKHFKNVLLHGFLKW